MTRNPAQTLSFISRSLTFGLALIASLASLSIVVSAQTLPSGFVRETVLSVSAPTAVAFTPDGRMLVTTQGGRLLVKNGAATEVTAITVNAASTGADPKICTESERGLLGIAVDPLFASNQYIYLFYTERNGSACQTGTYVSAGNYVTTERPVNRVSRFTLGNDNLVVLIKCTSFCENFNKQSSAVVFSRT